MARTRLTYAEAVKILVGGAGPITVLGQAAGFVLLAGIPVDSEKVLSGFDAKGEAGNLR